MKQRRQKHMTNKQLAAMFEALRLIAEQGDTNKTLNAIDRIQAILTEKTATGRNPATVERKYPA